MKQLMILAAAVMLAVPAMADTFGSGANQFTIEFVPISGDASSANGTNISQYESDSPHYKTFSDPDYNYRMGKFEITNDQWDEFVAAHGQPNGNPSCSYDADSYWTGASLPTNRVSWYEAAQFVNWLNTCTGHQAAYYFTGEQGTVDYTFGVWDATDAWGGTNLYRHKDAYYFLPTEDEWVKAAHWNGREIQAHSTRPGDFLHQGDGTSGTGWNYYTKDDEFAIDSHGPWNVGSGSEEINGTYDMMGNVAEWFENPWYNNDYVISMSGLYHWSGHRGCSYLGPDDNFLRSSYRSQYHPSDESYAVGFRVASIPEPMTLLLLGMGGMLVRRKK